MSHESRNDGFSLEDRVINWLYGDQSLPLPRVDEIKPFLNALRSEGRTVDIFGSTEERPDLPLSVRSESETPWVKVSESRPKWDPKADDVLAYTLTGHVVAVHPNRIDVLWNTRHDGEECFYTHWKPLPKGPQ